MIQIGEDAERGGGGDMVVYDAGYPVKEKTRENASFNICRFYVHIYIFLILHENYFDKNPLAQRH